MVLDANALKEKLIEAWKIRSSDRSFSASLAPLVAECRSEDEFRTIFTTQMLTHLDSAISSNLLESYFKFHTRSGYINEALVIERLLSLTPTRREDDVHVKFLIELLFETLKTMHVTAEHAVRLGRQLNLLAKWLCSALCFYANQSTEDGVIQLREEEMLLAISNLFLLLFTHTTYYCLWLRTIKSQKEQSEWRQLQEQVEISLRKLMARETSRHDVHEQVISKITRLHLSEEFHQEEIEFNATLFNPIVSLLVINQLHKSSTTLLIILRFYEHVSTTPTPYVPYLRLLQASFGGYLASVSTNNSEYQQRWSAFVNYQLPRIFASCLQTQFDEIKQALETFLLHSEYILNRMDELCVENVCEQFVQTMLTYVNDDVRTKHDEQIQQLLQYIQRVRQPYLEQIQKYYQTHHTHSYSFQILQSQRNLEQSLRQIFSSPHDEDNLQTLITNLTDYIPLICALDQYYQFIRLLLSYTSTHFDLALYLLCYVSSITDDISEDFGLLDIPNDQFSPQFVVYIWLKKYWLSRHLGHALFASTFESTDFLSTMSTSIVEKEEFAMDVKCFTGENIQVKYSSIDYLSRTVQFLGEVQSLAFPETKELVLQLINYLTHVSYGTLVHVLLWLIANYQVGNDDERPWIQNTITIIGTATTDTASTIFSLFDAIKRQLWSDFIDNSLLPYYSPIPSAASSIGNYLITSPIQTSTYLIETLSETYLNNEFFGSEQSRALHVCSKYIPLDTIIVRLLSNTSTSTGINETARALHLIFGLVLLRRRSSTRCLLETVLPYLYNMKSNEFMLEPNVYCTSLILSVLLAIDLQANTNEELFRVKSWRESSSGDLPRYEDTSVTDAFHFFLNDASEELFASETLRPVNYFLGWFQTILWTFSRRVRFLKPFVKAKLITQLSEYLPLQFPIEKVLSILELSTETEIEYASMAITRDYSRLQTMNTRTMKTLIQHPQLPTNDSKRTTENLTKNIFFIPADL